jgi:hypothetical protein
MKSTQAGMRMSRWAYLILVLFLPVILFGQDSPAKKGELPVQAQYSDRFRITDIYFNKKQDIAGRGEILEVQMTLTNQTDDPLELYIFTIATYETGKAHQTSFDIPIPSQKLVSNFVPYPSDITNFEYQFTDDKGQPVKDEQGKEVRAYKKIPKNTQTGVDPATGKPYLLKDMLVIRTEHLSRFKKNNTFFNNVAVLIFDKDGKPAFRQLYQLKGFRH